MKTGIRIIFTVLLLSGLQLHVQAQSNSQDLLSDARSAALASKGEFMFEYETVYGIENQAYLNHNYYLPFSGLMRIGVFDFMEIGVSNRFSLDNYEFLRYDSLQKKTLPYDSLQRVGFGDFALHAKFRILGTEKIKLSGGLELTAPTGNIGQSKNLNTIYAYLSLWHALTPKLELNYHAGYFHYDAFFKYPDLSIADNLFWTAQLNYLITDNLFLLSELSGVTRLSNLQGSYLVHTYLSNGFSYWVNSNFGLNFVYRTGINNYHNRYDLGVVWKIAD